MKKNKILALVLSFVMVLGMALPGTLAVSQDTASTGAEFAVATQPPQTQNSETPLTETENTPVPEVSPVVHSEGCADGCEVADCACACHAQPEASPAPTEAPVVHSGDCTDECAVEGCECDCHKATEAAPVEHLEGCADDCEAEDCACDCHTLSLYERLMACTTLDELFAIVDSTEQEELAALTEEEIAQIEAKIAALEGEPLPPVVVDEPENESVISKIIYPAVNFARVAPFGDPVVGVSNRPSFRPSLPFAAEEEPDDGMNISKAATANEGGTYTITLEAYATGASFITEVTEDVPADIVLVLDQSGSMKENMSTSEGYVAYQNRNNNYLYDCRFNGGSENLYYPLDGGYVQVQVDRVVSDYSEYPSNTTNSSYYQNRWNLYVKDANGSYQAVTIQRNGNFLSGYSYVYSVNGTPIATSDGADAIPDFGTNGPIYRSPIITEYEYTYYYQLEGQDRVNIETSRGRNTNPGQTYYQVGNITISRRDALESAVRTFANSVATKAAGPDAVLGTEDDVNHRVAVVGFASKDGNGNNTELLSISGTNSGSVGVEYDSITNQNLIDVLQDMDTTAGQNMVTSAINALAASGATEADLGMDMANRILTANPVSGGEKRSRVVVFFTDGSPTSSNGFEQAVADRAVNTANNIKAGGADVYSVGVFTGADATANGIAPGNDNRRENQFMQDVSSNNGTPQTPSYYLSASDAETLNSIFKQISDNIEDGGSSTTLNEEAVITDIIADQFQLPAGATEDDIKLYTANYIGDNQWGDPVAFDGEVTVDGSDVSVSGFNYSENWCGTETNNGTETYRGKKLIIEFNVVEKEGFLGGNDVYTNESAHLYENADAEEPLKEFNRPIVNVPIDEVAVTAQDKNVYLTGDLTAEQLRSGATVNVGDVALNLGAENYGLEAWQTEYVDIMVQYLDEAGNVVTNLNDLKDDTTYTVAVVVAPKAEATTDNGEVAVPQDGEATGDINVFLPTLTFKDSEVFYGQSGVINPDYFNTNNRVNGITWTHDGTDSTAVTMTGTAPAATDFGLTYTPDANMIDGDKINTKSDFHVNVAVKLFGQDINDYVNFAHDNCTHTDCGFNAESGEFMLHVNTCQLTIKKTGGAADEPYVFTILKDGVKYSEVTIVGNGSKAIAELPVGTYTIRENTDWSWRYNNPTYSKDAAELTATNRFDTITCTNSNPEPYWLNGYSGVVTNTYGVANK